MYRRAPLPCARKRIDTASGRARPPRRSQPLGSQALLPAHRARCRLGLCAEARRPLGMTNTLSRSSSTHGHCGSARAKDAAPFSQAPRTQFTHASLSSLAASELCENENNIRVCIADCLSKRSPYESHKQHGCLPSSPRAGQESEPTSLRNMYHMSSHVLRFDAQALRLCQRKGRRAFSPAMRTLFIHSRL